MKDTNGVEMKSLRELATEMGYNGNRYLIEIQRSGILKGVFVETRKDKKQYFHVQDESALVISLARHMRESGHHKQDPRIKEWVDDYIVQFGLADQLTDPQTVQDGSSLVGGIDDEMDIESIPAKNKSDAAIAFYKAGIAKIELQKAMASVLDAKVVEDFMAKIAIELKHSLLSVPNACIQDVLAAETEHEAEAIVYAAIEKCLSRLSTMGAEWDRLKEDQVIEMTK